MSTPIANIPIASGKTEEDPEVADLLNEMNAAAPIPPPIHREVVKQRPIHAQFVYEEQKQFFHYETAQKALYLAAIAFIVFYPTLLNPVYEKFPVFEKFKNNELLIRSAVLGVIVYAILWRFYL
jgi:hypothetical protein